MGIHVILVIYYLEQKFELYNSTLVYTSQILLFSVLTPNRYYQI